MVEQVVAEVGLDPAARAIEYLTHEVPGNAGGERHRHEEQSEVPDLREWRAGAQRVDPMLQIPWNAHVQRIGHHDHGQSGSHDETVRPEIGQQRPKLTHEAAMSPRGDTRASYAKEALMMSRTLLIALALGALAACGGDKNENVAAADSLTRDLQLAPVDSGAPLNDQPAAAPAPDPAPAAAPKPAARRPQPKPAAPA